MPSLTDRTAFRGFGEAAMAFAEGCKGVRVYDIKTDNPATAATKHADYRRFGVQGAETLAAAIGEADLILSLVTADQALPAAEAAARSIKSGALYYDFNSVAPATKREAAEAIQAAGGRYVDVAVLAPVLPARLAVPLLISGPHSAEALQSLVDLGFKPRVIDGPIGQASMIKMLRSVMIKGLEALTTECFLAAHKTGLVEEVAASLAASWPGVDWTAKADYNLDRMMIHGLRRASEMDEVATTLASLGVDNRMSRATAGSQRAIGSLELTSASGFEAKSDMVLQRLGGIT